MHDAHWKLLIVDNDVSIRTSLSLTFIKLGCRVRSCEDCFSAQTEIRREIPDVLLSDLNMTRMPCLEFLRVVRHWFPSIRVIAMGDALSENRVPPGAAADAYFQKGTSLTNLIETVHAMTQPSRPASRLSIENLFGFQVIEAIPPHPVAVRLTFPVHPIIEFPVRHSQHPGEVFRREQ